MAYRRLLLARSIADYACEHSLTVGLAAYEIAVFDEGRRISRLTLILTEYFSVLRLQEPPIAQLVEFERLCIQKIHTAVGHEPVIHERQPVIRYGFEEQQGAARQFYARIGKRRRDVRSRL